MNISVRVLARTLDVDNSRSDNVTKNSGLLDISVWIFVLCLDRIENGVIFQGDNCRIIYRTSKITRDTMKISC